MGKVCRTLAAVALGGTLLTHSVAAESANRVLTPAGDSLIALPERAFGSNNEELVLTPVTPCRMVNTTLVGGAFAPGEIRGYDLIGPSNYASIGGNPAGCGIPGVLPSQFEHINITRGLVLNLIAVGPLGPGDFRAWPSDEPMPNASVLNYSASGATGGLNIANGIILKTCSVTAFQTAPCPNGDLRFLAEVSGSHLIVDVVGYLTAPNLDQLRHSVLAGSNDNVVNLTNACVGLEGCSLSAPDSSGGTVLVTATVQFQMNHTTGTATTADFQLVNDMFPYDCSGIDGASGLVSFEWAAANPTTGCCQDHSVSLSRSFSLAAGASGDYHVIAEEFGGDLQVEGVNMSCVFIPRGF